MKLLIFAVILLHVSFPLCSKTIHVGAGFPVRQIQAAIRQAHAGDTVMVHGGVYKEGNLLIDKSLVVLGKNYPVLDGQKKFEVVSIKANQVVFDGFRVQHSGFASLDDPGAIKVYNGHHLTISNNILEDNFFGIYIQYGKNCLIKNNQIRAYGKEEQQIGNGIHC
ncbi:MAG: right-handed parallel beta-helix repeat-containing protein, partial [Saprospiraceae bacterium]|nr:right-handed parallel beta-helix repeat-containing protein [Saprospiraceae bacterium]